MFAGHSCQISSLSFSFCLLSVFHLRNGHYSLGLADNCLRENIFEILVSYDTNTAQMSILDPMKNDKMHSAQGSTA